MFDFSDLLSNEADRPALINGNRVMSRRALAERAAEVAAGLAERGFRRGDLLAIWLPDGPDWLALFFAAARLGVLVVPISTRYRAFEVAAALGSARPKALVIKPDFLDIDFTGMLTEIAPDLPSIPTVIEIGEDESVGSLRVVGRSAAAPRGQASDPLCTFSTSGTTGKSKLAIHDQQSIARHATLVARAFDIRPGDVMLCALPLYGVLGFVKAISALAAGAACVQMPVYRAEAAAAAIERHKVTHFMGSDAIFEAVLRGPGRDLRSWRVGGFADFTGHAARVTEEAERRIGLRLTGLYGSSECFALMAKTDARDEIANRALAGGAPISPDISVRVVDVNTGERLPDGKPGELQVKGYNVLSCYLNNPAATAAAFTGDGWFRTGDLAYGAGPGFVYLARIKDSLRLRGYLVDPTEIEEYLLRHDGVEVAQVVGAQRPEEGEVAIAFVRVKRNTVTEAELIDFCRAGIAAYKVPRRIAIVDQFPEVHSANGTKIQKNKLRDLAREMMGAADLQRASSKGTS